MNVKDVAELTRLPAKTIRYYEEIGLVSPARSENGYRVYAARDMHRLGFLARARSLGFSLEDCRTLLSLYDDQDRSSAEVRTLAKDHILEIDHKLSELRAMRRTLTRLVDACHGDSRPDCPIIDTLAAPEPSSKQGGGGG